MPTFNAHQLRKWTNGEWRQGQPAALAGFAFDTRRLEPGQCFLALRGERVDGHSFLREAARAGATAAIVERVDPTLALPQLLVEDTLAALQRAALAHRRTFRGPVIGVTGSCGKTSTKELLSCLLGDDLCHRTPGNWNNHLGVPLTLLGIDPERHAYAVVEAGINSCGEMDGLAAMIEPDASVVTMVGAAHLEQLGSLQGVAREKAKLCLGTLPQGDRFFPAELAQYDAFRGLTGNIHALAVSGESLPASFQTTNLTNYTVTNEGGSGAPEGRRLELTDATGALLAFHGPAVSPGMSRNVLLALNVARHLGVPANLLQHRLDQWRPADQRGQIIPRGQASFYVDCYNANPSSMSDALAHFAATTPEQFPRLYVLGGMAELGPEAAQWHREVGARVRLRKQDRAVVIGEHRFAYHDGLMAAGNGKRQVEVCTETPEARPLVHRFTGSVLLKGSRRYQLESLLPPATAPAAQVAC